MAPSGNKLEIILALSVDAFSKSVKVAAGTIKEMSSSIGGSMRKVDADFNRAIVAGQKFRATMESMNGTANSVRNTLAGMLAAVGGANLFQTATSSAFSFNQTIEQSKIGIAALVRTFTSADLGKSFVVAEEIQKRLQIAGLKTVATYQELLRALQEGIGPALREGFNPEQIVAFTTGMTQAAAAISLPMDQLGQELRAILDGTIDRNARIANALRISNEDVKGWKTSGTLFDELKKKLAAFSVAGEQAANTFGGALSNMSDAIQMALGKGSEATFSATTAAIKRVQDAIVTIDEKAGTFTFNEKIMAALKEIDVRVSTFLASVTGDQIAAALVNIAETAGAVVEVLGSVAQVVVSIFDALGPLAPDLVKMVGYLMLFSLGWKTLAFAIGEPYRLLKSVGVAIAELTKLNALAWLGNLRGGLTFAAIAAGGLKSVIGGLAGVVGAAIVGIKIGEFFYQEFDAVKKAGNRIASTLTMVALKAKKAWAWLSGGDTDAVQREIDEAKRIYDELYKEIGSDAKAGAGVQVEEQKKVTAEVERSASRQKQVTGEALEAMKKQYKEYSDEIKRLQGELLSEEISLDQQLREVKRQGMTDDGVYKDKIREFKEYMAVVNAAEYSAQAAIKKGDLSGATENIKTMKQFAEQAKSVAGGLATEIKKGDATIMGQADGIEAKMKLLGEAGGKVIDSIKLQQEALDSARDTLVEKSGFQDLAKGLDEYEQKWHEDWSQMQAKSIEAVDAVEERIEKMVEKDRTVYINVKERQEKSSGGPIGYQHGGLIGALRMAGGGAVTAFRNMLSGGFFPGFGGGDRRHVVAEDGEYMLDKYRVRDAGLGTVRAFHAGRYDIVIAELSKRLRQGAASAISRSLGGLIDSIPTVPAIGPQYMSAGGAVQGGGNILRHEHTLRLGKAAPVTVYTDDRNAGKLIAMLKRAERFSS